MRRMKGEHNRRGGARWWIFGCLAVVGLLAGFEALVRPAFEARTALTGGAQWIWSHAGPEDGWTVFFVARDFEVQNPPSRAELLVAADEEYVVYLNGHTLGLGTHTPGAVDRYEVGAALVRGANRILVELRSSRAIGGLLLSLREADAQTAMIVSDAAWRVVREYREEIKWPGSDLEGVPAVKVWGAPPVGRWGEINEVRPRRVLERSLVSRKPLPAARLRLDSDTGAPWHPHPTRPRRELTLGRWVTFDFGSRVNGYLNLVFHRRSGGRGLLYFGDRPPIVAPGAPPAGRILATSGQGSWTDTGVRTFRYVTVVSTAELSAAQVFVVKPEFAEEGVPKPADGKNGSVPGVLGLTPPRSGTPVEDEFWSEFERLSSGAGGEDRQGAVGL